MQVGIGDRKIEVFNFKLSIRTNSTREDKKERKKKKKKYYNPPTRNENYLY